MRQKLRERELRRSLQQKKKKEGEFQKQIRKQRRKERKKLRSELRGGSIEEREKVRTELSQLQLCCRRHAWARIKGIRVASEAREGQFHQSSFKKKKNHVYWKSSTFIPLNGPILLFCKCWYESVQANLLGIIDPNTPLSKLIHACNIQKCTRAGGKYNDLDDVGKDAYHHTFVEMLGNWSRRGERPLSPSWSSMMCPAPGTCRW